MARPRKNSPKPNTQELSLVPVEEQPYPLPEGWKWVRGHALFKPQVSLRPSGTTFKYIDIDAVNNKNQTIQSAKILPTSEAPSRANRGVHEGDTLFSMVRPYLRNIAYVDASLSDAIASTGFYICSPLDGCNSRYIFHMMTSCYVVDGLNKFMKGDNSPSVRKGDIENFPFPLPPLDEQERIVTRIESLFAKLDEAKEKAEAVLDSYETRKAAILHKAFTGELTAKWREERRVTKESWENAPLKQLSSLITKGASPKWQGIAYVDDNSQTLFVTSENVREGYLSLENKKFVEDTINNIQKRSCLMYGDILINIVGASIGRAAIYYEQYKANINQAVCLVRLNRDTSTDYICAYLNSPAALAYYFENKVETARANLSLADISGMIIPLPSLDEQQEITRILDSLLEKELQSKEAAETVLEQIDLMKKAILAKAFRGELG